MTLVEVLAGFFIALFLLMIAGNLLVTSTNLFGKHQNQQEIRQIINYVSSFLKEELTYANKVEVSHDKTSQIGSEHTLTFTQEGTVLVDDEPLYQGIFENEMIYIQVELDKEKQTDIFDYTIRIEGPSQKVKDVSHQVIKLVNMSHQGNVVIDSIGENKELDSDGQTIYVHYQ